MNLQTPPRLPTLLLAAALALAACSEKPESANEVATQQLIEATQKAEEAAARAEAAQKALEQAEADKKAADEKAAAEAAEEAAAAKLAAEKAKKRAAAAAKPKPVAETPKAVCTDCGTVTAITPVQIKGEGTGMGAVAGAIAGAVIGHQFGRGKGNTAAKVAGAAVGGYAGNAAEKNIRATTVYDVSVRMDDGGNRTVRVGDASALSNGERVRVAGDNIEKL